MTGIPQPTILPSPDAVPFWRAARRHELVLPNCLACAEPFFYPRTFCPRCGSRDLDWQPASGQGVLHAFCIHFQTGIAADREHLPFVSAIVELAEGPRLMSYLVDVEPSPDAIRCDMPVSVRFVDLPDGQTLPVFEPSRGQGCCAPPGSSAGTSHRR
ncbi:MAG TPA: OB-fold domain-containing protein [Pseudonocardiaceae bacterium]|nr:OB-fold domain-containing protein [Pseudonocardiaceae bacterium]